MEELRIVPDGSAGDFIQGTGYSQKGLLQGASKGIQTTRQSNTAHPRQSLF